MRNMIQQFLPALLVLTFLIIFLKSDRLVAIDDESTSSTEVKQNRPAIFRLAPLANLVGKWRGVGQPQRGSNSGAWTETTSCQWKFEDHKTALMVKVESGKQFQELQFEPTDARSGNTPADVRLWMLLPDESRREFRYQADASTDTTLVFLSDSESTPQYRCTVRKISDIRTTILLEQKSSSMGSFRRTAEIGYTRDGERLAVANSGERQCIVTGGLGTISVVFEGHTYYVCCEGCRQAFDADPKGTIQSWKNRVEEEKRSRNNPR